MPADHASRTDQAQIPIYQPPPDPASHAAAPYPRAGRPKNKGPAVPAPCLLAESPTASDLEGLDSVLDRDLLDLGQVLDLRSLRHADLEHAVVVLRLDLGLLDALRDRHVALEEAVGGLLAVVPLFLDLLVGLPLTGDRHVALDQLDVDVLRLHAGQVELDHEVSVAGEHVGRRDEPLAGREREQRPERPWSAQRAEELREGAVDLDQLLRHDTSRHLAHLLVMTRG